MKTALSVALCALVSTHALAAGTYAQWQTVDGQRRIVHAEISPTRLVTTKIPVKKSPVKPLEKAVTSASIPSKGAVNQTVKTTTVNPPPSLVETAIAANKQKQTMASTTIKTPKTAKPKPPVPHFVVTQGQTYQSALNQWLGRANMKKVAWSLPATTRNALNTPSPHGNVFNGTMAQAVESLSKTIQQPLHFAQDKRKGLVALHTFNSPVDIKWVHGNTLNDAVKNLVTDYGWHWNDGKHDQGDSWMTSDDFQFVADYPLVTPQYDMAYALNSVIDGYPVQAKVLNATHTIFIVEKE
ncbi:hypothetical protein [Photobacterium indicum]|uniref:hypothetical protein n=1 Tax=Photobacterium indicum TaxID=81447 RepID=UPI003D0DD4AE